MTFLTPFPIPEPLESRLLLMSLDTTQTLNPSRRHAPGDLHVLLDPSVSQNLQTYFLIVPRALSYRTNLGSDDARAAASA